MEQKAILEKINELCGKNGETDAAGLKDALEGMTTAEASACISQLDEAGLIVTYEIDMCCGEELVVQGLTDAGMQMLG